MKKGFTHYLFVQGMIQREIATAGRLSTAFSSQELAMGFYGLMNVYVMGALINRKVKGLNRRTAERIARLYLEGAMKK